MEIRINSVMGTREPKPCFIGLRERTLIHELGYRNFFYWPHGSTSG